MKTSLKLSLIVVGGALSAVLIPTGAASATTTQECETQLATLRTDTVAAQSSFSNQTSFTHEVGKLDATAAKLAEGKNADAVQKLADFQSTLNALATAPKPKVDPYTAETLGNEAQGVINCVNTIEAA